MAKLGRIQPLLDKASERYSNVLLLSIAPLFHSTVIRHDPLAESCCIVKSSEVFKSKYFRLEHETPSF